MATRGKLLAFGALAFAGSALARRIRRYNLDGKIVLVSGGSRGLGLVLAREFARRGARLALLARDTAELQRARVDLVTRGANDVVLLPCDITDRTQVEQAAADVLHACGRVDVLANVAGDIEVGPFESMRLEDFERAMATNFWGALHLVQVLLPGMRSRGGGRIVNVSSIGGVVAVPHLLPYVASKFALTGFSLGLRAELAKLGIVVTTVCPGLMRTGSPDNALFKGNRAAEFGWFAASDAMPLLSTSAERAARRIVRAVERGDAMVRITLPAKFAAIAQSLAPETVARALELADRMLPRGTDSSPASTGRDSRSARLPRWLTALSDRAAARNNENAPATERASHA